MIYNNQLKPIRTTKTRLFKTNDFEQSLPPGPPNEARVVTNQELGCYHTTNTNSAEDTAREQMIRCRIENGMPTSAKTLLLRTNLDSISNWMGLNLASFPCVQVSRYEAFASNYEQRAFISCREEGTTIRVTIYDDPDNVIELAEKFKSAFSEVLCYIQWVYDQRGSTAEIPLIAEKLPIQEMYPMLREPLHDYYDRFMKSSSGILLLIGPPGTAKTTFIRGLLCHTQTSAIVTYDTAVLSQDSVFANFVESADTSVMVLEDSDAFLSSRSDGNDMMHRFLNVGDGLVSMAGKKMIFSTNLPSIKDIDEALVRPGRCFDILEFSPLNKTDSVALALKMNLDFTPEKEYNTVAEIFGQSNAEIRSPIKSLKSIGF